MVLRRWGLMAGLEKWHGTLRSVRDICDGKQGIICITAGPKEFALPGDRISWAGLELID